jgi:hypothetical protein
VTNAFPQIYTVSGEFARLVVVQMRERTAARQGTCPVVLYAACHTPRPKVHSLTFPNHMTPSRYRYLKKKHRFASNLFQQLFVGICFVAQLTSAMSQISILLKHSVCSYALRLRFGDEAIISRLCKLYHDDGDNGIDNDDVGDVTNCLQVC